MNVESFQGGSSVTLFSQLTKHVESVWGSSVAIALPEDVEMLEGAVNRCVSLLERGGIGCSNLTVAIVTGCTTSNGHAFLSANGPVVWLSASSYPTDLAREVFVLHEMIHGIHYGAVPEYAPSRPEQKDHVGRQLVVEGLATLATRELLGCSDEVALWGGYLDTVHAKALGRRYIAHRAETASKIAATWDRVDQRFFYASDEADVDAYRSGYALGLYVLSLLAEEHGDWKALLSTPRAVLDGWAMEVLQRLV